MFISSELEEIARCSTKVMVMIQYFEAPPFIVTLAGMFFARGLGYVLSLSSIPVNGPFFHVMSTAGLRFAGGAKLTVPAMTFLFILLQKAFMAGTKLGKERV